jgi:hypothetical protein
LDDVSGSQLPRLWIMVFAQHWREDAVGLIFNGHNCFDLNFQVFGKKTGDMD